MRKFNFFFCINILITNENPYMRPLLLQIIAWEVKGARNGKTVHKTGRPCKLTLHIYGIHLLNPYKTVVSHLNRTIMDLLFKLFPTCALLLRLLGASSITFEESSFLIESISTNLCPLPSIVIMTRSKPALLASSVCPSGEKNIHSVSLPEKEWCTFCDAYINKAIGF